MPPGPYPPEPSALHRAFSAHGPVDWQDNARTAAEIANLYGAKAARRSLEALHQAVAVEPRITAQFLTALPPTASPYHLDRRIKSPESLARKFRTMEKASGRRPVTDVLRYTVLTETPDDLVQAARHATDALTTRGCRVTYAMHSYVDGARYKGMHAYLKTPDFPRIEVQFHSIPSVQVKELTTSLYGIDRSPTTTDEERAAARRLCVEASAHLQRPFGIDDLATLGGRPVVVNNYYSESGHAAAEPRRSRSSDMTPGARNVSTLDRNDGIAR